MLGSKIKLVAVLIAAFALYACKGNQGKIETNSLTVNHLFENADALVNDTISITGFCTSVCSHSGDHLTLMGSDSTAMIEVRTNPTSFTFPKDILYSNLEIKGVFLENKVTKEFLNDWEFRLDESLKGDKGNPEYVDMFKKQIEAIRAAIAVREKEEGKDYWSQYSISSLGYKVLEDK